MQYKYGCNRTRLPSLVVISLSAILLFGLPEGTQSASSAELPHPELTLLDAGAWDGALLAGVEIALEPHVKTYWRMPGDSGLPPVFDWSASDNLDSASVLWPLPKRIADPAGTILGYDEDVVFPVRVKAKNPSKPVHLVLKLDYAVCGDLCVPVTGKTDVTLTNTAEPPPNAVRVKTFLARVPASAPLGASLISVTPDPDDAQALLVEARHPLTDLLVEGPDGWYLGDAQARSPTLWRIAILQKPTQATLSGLHLTVTLVSQAQATETSVMLDANGAIR